MKKRQTNFLVLMLLIPVFFIGCQKSELIDDSKTTNTESDGSGNLKSTKSPAITYCGTQLVANLVNYEQTINAGTVTIGNDATKLYVTIATTGDWLMGNSALYVGPVGTVPGYINPDGSGHFEIWNFPPCAFSPIGEQISSVDYQCLN